MFNNTWFWTSIIAATYTTISLSFLKFFNFIQWSPTKWIKKAFSFTSHHFIIQWVILFIIVIFIFALLYIIVSFTTSIPPSVTAILLGILIVFLVEWTIELPKTPIHAIRSISIPFLVMIAIATRFITGTAVFMKKISLENRK